MSNFKHEHILRLLGVCLDNDPNYIIMELMEEGDLLSYLRAKRASLVISINYLVLIVITDKLFFKYKLPFNYFRIKHIIMKSRPCDLFSSNLAAGIVFT